MNTLLNSIKYEIVIQASLFALINKISKKRKYESKPLFILEQSKWKSSTEGTWSLSHINEIVMLILYSTLVWCPHNFWLRLSDESYFALYTTKLLWYEMGNSFFQTFYLHDTKCNNFFLDTDSCVWTD